MTKTIASMAPIAIATLLMLYKMNTKKSTSDRILLKLGTPGFMGIGILTGISIFLIMNGGFTAENASIIGNTVLSTVTGNVMILLSILLLFVLVYLIRNSKAIDALNALAEEHLNTPGKLIIVLILLGVVFSLDDYLACMAMSAILTAIAGKQGFSKEKTAYMINLTAVACCCLAPFSSWMPVIRGSLMDSGLNESILLQLLPYNFTAIVALGLIAMIGFFHPTAFGSHAITKTVNKVKPKRNGTLTIGKELGAFVLIFAVLIASLLSMLFVFDCSNAVIKSTVLSIVVAIPVLLRIKSIDLPKIVSSLKSAVKDSLDLSKLLLSIWLLTGVCNDLLGLSDHVSALTNSASLQAAVWPVVIYVAASAFSFFTGSSYGTFGLFIPLAVKITANASEVLQLLSIAAAVSGSLMAAFALTSDTMKLTAENTKSDIQYLQRTQLPYSMVLFLLGIVSFSLGGFCSPYGKLAVFLIPVAITLGLCLCGFVLTSNTVPKTSDKPELAFEAFSEKEHLEPTSSMGSRPYPVYTFTFHSKYKFLETALQIMVRMVLHIVVSFNSFYRTLKQKRAVTE